MSFLLNEAGIVDGSFYINAAFTTSVAPIMDASAEIEVEEDAGVFGTYAATNTPIPAATYTLSGIDADYLTIDEDTGEVNTVNGTNYDVKPAYKFTVTATNDEGSAATSVVVVITASEKPTVTEVRAILPTGTGLTDSQILMAISASGCMITQAKSCCASHIDDDCMKHAWEYLAAHFAAATENTLSISSETTECGGSATYGFNFGEGVLGTPFGILANSLSGGCLQEQDKRPAGIFTLGLRCR